MWQNIIGIYKDHYMMTLSSDINMGFGDTSWLETIGIPNIRDTLFQREYNILYYVGMKRAFYTRT